MNKTRKTKIFSRSYLNFCRIFVEFFFVCASSVEAYTSGCDKVKCRYNQREAGVMFASDFVHEEIKHAPSRHYWSSVIEIPHQICYNYISSSSIGLNDFEKMLNCTSIDLSWNGIDYIERIFLKDLKQLESLNLSHNQLKLLPENVFDDLVSLKKLEIRNNLLESLNEGVFKFNPKLKSVDFSENKLKIIPSTIFSNTKKLRYASFAENFCVDKRFPRLSLRELENHFETNCSERNLKTFSIKLSKILLHLKNGAFASNGTLINGTTQFENVTGILTSTQKNNSTTESIPTTTARNVEKDLDIFIVSLFWLIITIVLILFAIVAIIIYAIYKKYFVYLVSFGRNESI